MGGETSTDTPDEYDINDQLKYCYNVDLCTVDFWSMPNRTLLVRFTMLEWSKLLRLPVNWHENSTYCMSLKRFVVLKYRGIKIVEPYQRTRPGEVFITSIEYNMLTNTNDSIVNKYRTVVWLNTPGDVDSSSSGDGDRYCRMEIFEGPTTLRGYHPLSNLTHPLSGFNRWAQFYGGNLDIIENDYLSMSIAFDDWDLILNDIRNISEEMTTTTTTPTPLPSSPIVSGLYVKRLRKTDTFYFLRENILTIVVTDSSNSIVSEVRLTEDDRLCLIVFRVGQCV